MTAQPDAGLLENIRRLDHKRRYDHCVGVISAAQAFFLKEHQVQQQLKAIDSPMSRYGGFALFAFGVALDWFLREGKGLQFTYGTVFIFWAVGMWWYRAYSIYRGTRDLHGYRDNLTMLLCAWVGAGASEADFSSIRKFITDDDFDRDSPKYREWWYGWSRDLEHHCDVVADRGHDYKLSDDLFGKAAVRSS